MRLSVLLLLVACLLVVGTVALENDIPQEILNAHFAGRSGDFYIGSQKVIVEDNSVLLMVSPSGLSKGPGTKAPPAVQDVQVADLIAHSLGSAPLNFSAPVHFSVGTPFQRARANFMVVLDGVGKDLLRQYPSLQMLSMGSESELEQTSFNADSVSMLTTVMTGAPPSEHGIVGASWLGGGSRVQAFRSSAGLSKVSNLPDRLSTASMGRSLVIGASADPQLASALSVHQALYADHPFWNDFSFFWNEERGGFRSMYPYALHEPEFELSRNSLLGFHKKLSLPGSVATLHYQRRKVSVSFPGKALSVTFDLDNAEDFAFWAEVQFALATVDALEQKQSFQQLVADSAPDHIALGFSSLRALATGADPDKFRAALYLTDALVVSLTSRLDAVYEGRLAAQVLFLKPKPAAAAVPASVQAALSSVYLELTMQAPLQAMLPVIPLPDNHRQQKQLLCNKFRTALATKAPASGFTAWCPESSRVDLAAASGIPPSALANNPLPFLPALLEQTNGTGGGNSTGRIITWEAVWTFQVSLWISVFMVVAMISASMALFAVDIPRDSPLIRQMPNLFHSPGQAQQRNLW